MNHPFVLPVALFHFPFLPDELVLVSIALLCALLAVVLLTPVAMRIATAAGVLDHPHARRVHTKPTPRWGGLAMYAAFVITVLIMVAFKHDLWNSRVWGILIGGLLITTLGALDDKYDVPAKVKLAGQVLIAMVLPLFGVRLMNAFDLYIDPHNLLIGSLLTVLWVVAVTNTINLLDGLDGLASGVSGIATLTFVVIALAIAPANALSGEGGKDTMIGFAIVGAALVGVCIGFLRYNFHPAKVFMGDAGSHFLGYTIAALSILQNWKVAAGVAFAVPILILAVPLFDTGFAIIRRLRRGQPIFSPDKGHLHHRLLSLGLNQRTVVLTIYLLTAIGCAVAVMLAHARLTPD